MREFANSHSVRKGVLQHLLNFLHISFIELISLSKAAVSGGINKAEMPAYLSAKGDLN